MWLGSEGLLGGEWLALSCDTPSPVFFCPRDLGHGLCGIRVSLKLGAGLGSAEVSDCRSKLCLPECADPDKGDDDGALSGYRDPQVPSTLLPLQNTLTEHQLGNRH